MVALLLLGLAAASARAQDSVVGALVDQAREKADAALGGGSTGGLTGGPTGGPAAPGSTNGAAPPVIPDASAFAAGNGKIAEAAVSRSQPLYALLGNTNYRPQMTTLFFSFKDQAMVDEIHRLRAAGRDEDAIALVGATLQQDPIDTLMGTPTSTTIAKPAPPPPDVPIFYLSSILYGNADEWALWLNGRRFTSHAPATPDGKLEVIAVSTTEASFSWLPYQYPRLSAMISAQALGAQPKFHSNRTDSTGRIGLDEKNMRILFTLRPNQSFYTKDVRLGEGLPFRESAASRSLPSTTTLGGAGGKGGALVRQVAAPGAAATPPYDPAVLRNSAAPSAGPAPVTGAATNAAANTAMGASPAMGAAPGASPVAAAAAPRNDTPHVTKPAAAVGDSGYREVNGLIQRGPR